MQFYKFSVPVGATFPITAAGSYVRYYKNTAGSSAPTIEVRTDKGEAMLLATNESARANRPFTQLTITNFDASAQIDGIVQIGDGEISQNTFSGNVAVTSTTNNGPHVNAKVTVTNASALLRAAAAAARYLMIQNPDTSAANLHIRTDGGVAVADASSIKLRPGESYEPGEVPTGQINAISSGVNIDVQITTG